MIEHLWVVVLAGGSGRRLAGITTDASAEHVPEQFCSLRQGGSLLAMAIARAERLVPPGRVIVVVSEAQARHWRPALQRRPPQNIVRQPLDRGTAPAVLLPLCSILARDRHARIVLLPSDHFVADEHVLNHAIGRALADIEELRGWSVLLGMMPDAPESDYGWILPEAGVGLVRSVAAFVEKPDRQAAAGLQRAGAVWNSMMLVAHARTLLQLYRQHLPWLLHAFRRNKPHRSAAAAAELYRLLPARDFSRDVLQGAESMLRVRLVPECGWTDLGTPKRVHRCLARCTGTSTASPGAPTVAAVDLSHRLGRLTSGVAP